MAYHVKTGKGSKAGEKGERNDAAHVRGRRVARASDAPSRDALRGILRCVGKRALDCAFARAW